MNNKEDINRELYIQSHKKQTNHKLHLFISILTIGIWVIPWILISIVNNSKNVAMEDRVKKTRWKSALKSFLQLFTAIIIISFLAGILLRNP